MEKINYLKQCFRRDIINAKKIENRKEYLTYFAVDCFDTYEENEKACLDYLDELSKEFNFVYSYEDDYNNRCYLKNKNGIYLQINIVFD